MKGCYYPAEEFKSREFDIYDDIPDPYDNTKSVGKISLEQAVYCGGDLYIVPMQVFKTENPLLLKVVFLISDLYWIEKGETSMAEINGCNIRISDMTYDGKLRWDTVRLIASVSMTSAPKRSVTTMMKVEIIDKYRFGVTVTLALSPFLMLGAAALLWRNPPSGS